MKQEIERKFLVKSDAFKTEALKKISITQSYLSSVPGRTVRIRLKGDKGFITIKGECNDSGTSRFEWEKEIPADEAVELMKIAEPGIINKTRYQIKKGNHTYEVDEFFGENQGLTVAEIELQNEDESFEKPEWLGEEVTGNMRYYNSMLINNPYKKW